MGIVVLSGVKYGYTVVRLNSEGTDEDTESIFHVFLGFGSKENGLVDEFW